MTIYINKNFCTQNVWIKKEIEEPEMVYFLNLFLSFLWLCGMHGAITISNINIQNHVHFLLFMKTSFIIFTNLSYFLLLCFYHSLTNRRTVFLHVWAYLLRITVAHGFFYHIPSVFLSLITSGWSSESASTFPFLT